MNNNHMTNLLDLYEWDPTPDLAKIISSLNLDDLNNLRLGEVNNHHISSRPSAAIQSSVDQRFSDIDDDSNGRRIINDLNCGGFDVDDEMFSPVPPPPPGYLDSWDDPSSQSTSIPNLFNRRPGSSAVSLLDAFSSQAGYSSFRCDSLSNLLLLGSSLAPYSDNDIHDQGLGSPSPQSPVGSSTGVLDRFDITNETTNVTGPQNDKNGSFSASSLGFLTPEGGGLTGSDFFMRKLGGFRNIGWTLNHRLNDFGQTEHQALVYSLHTFHSYASGWMSDDNDALKAALTKCYEAEKGDHDCNDKGTQLNGDLFSSMTTPTSSESEGTTALNTITSFTDNDDNLNKLLVSRQTSLSSTSPQSEANSIPINLRFNIGNEVDQNTVVLVWSSYIPSTMSSEMVIAFWKSLLPSTSRLLGMLNCPAPSQGLLIFQDLSSAIEFIRTAKSKQLECFDLLVAGDRQSCLQSSDRSLLFHPITGDAIGFGLVNISPQHPTCIHTLLRLSQKDAVALGHKRTSTETLRLLLTHPEVSPVMVIPSAQPFGSYSLCRTTPLSQTPSHRRASIWCALCCTQSSDIPGAWKHLSRNPHEALRVSRNTSLLEWVASEHPALFATLVMDQRSETARTVEVEKPKDSSKSFVQRFDSDGMDQFNLLNTDCYSTPARLSNFSSKSWSFEKTVNSSLDLNKGLNPEAPAFVPGDASVSRFPAKQQPAYKENRHKKMNNQIMLEMAYKKSGGFGSDNDGIRGVTKLNREPSLYGNNKIMAEY